MRTTTRGRRHSRRLHRTRGPGLAAALLLPFAGGLGAAESDAARAPAPDAATAAAAGSAAVAAGPFAAGPSGDGHVAPPLPPAADRGWTGVPLETLGDDHRVREGHVAAPEAIARDTDAAARGTVVGSNPAYGMLREAARKADGHPYHHHGYEEVWIADIGVLLTDDRDGDGFFGRFELSLDVDTDSHERDVYAVIELSDELGVPSLRHATEAFTIRGNASSDEYRIEVELLRNHPAGYRDVRVDVRDSFDGELLDTASARGFSSLSALPLEAERDGFADDGFADDVVHDDPIDHGHGYGAAGTLGTDDAYVSGYAAANGPGAALALAALALLRRVRRAREPAA